VYGLNSSPSPVTTLGGEALPLDIGIRDDVRVVVADGAVRLALERHALDRGDLPLEPRIDVGHLLAERRRRRGLAVRAREHRHRRVVVRQRAQDAGDAAQRGQQHLAARVASITP
jgi:hypothetical protein